MANTYAANFGDVVKHAVLCEVFVREQPVRYLESHGGRLDYNLAEIEPGPGGVWDFIELGTDREALASSTYARLVREVAGTRHSPGRYPGSIAFAASLLPADAEVIAFELVEASASNLLEGLAARGRSAQVQLVDGLSGVCRLAEPGDLVLLDPFHVHARGERLTAAEAFVVLASRGVATILWYAIYEPTESDDWTSEAVRDVGRGAWHVRLVGETADGGLAGCGFVTAHLSPETEAAATAIVNDLASALIVVRPGLRVE